MKECRETLEQAIQVRDFYRDNVEVVTNGNQPKLEQVETDLEKFDSDLKNVFEVRERERGREGNGNTVEPPNKGHLANY